MPFLNFFLLLVCHVLTGYGILFLFDLRLKAAYTITLSLLLGLAVASLLPFLLQLLYIPLTPFAVFGSLVLVAVVVNLPVMRRIRQEGPAAFRKRLPSLSFQLKPYEIPFLVIIGFLVFVSIWRCYYLPPTSRDALSGPEAIADIAVREHSLINSFFSVDLWSTNNQFKSPFLISLQLIYKMAGFPFGQIWLSLVFISITVFLYHALCERLHPVLAGMLLLLFTMTPEMYAYTFMILYDYSNMVFFFLALYFLFGWLRDPGGRRSLYFAGLLMGIATYIRSETLALAILFLPPLLLAQRQQKMPVKKILVSNCLFLLPSFLGYLLPSELYIKYYLPVHYDIAGLFNEQPASLGPLFRRYGDIVTRLMTGDFATHLWGYFYYLAAVLALAELVFVRRFSREARLWLYAILVLYIGIGGLGWLLPMMNLNETTKRALFKMLPLLLLYLANNELLVRLSVSISRWENIPFTWEAGGASRGKSTSSAQRTVLTRTGRTTTATTRSAGTAKAKQVPPGGISRKKRK